MRCCLNYFLKNLRHIYNRGKIVLGRRKRICKCGINSVGSWKGERTRESRGDYSRVLRGGSIGVLVQVDSCDSETHCPQGCGGFLILNKIDLALHLDRAK